MKEISVKASQWLLLFFLALFYAELHASMTYLTSYANLYLLASFKAAAPFQLRILIPAIVHWLERLFSLEHNLGFFVMEVVGWFSLLLVARHHVSAWEGAKNRFTLFALSTTCCLPLVFTLLLPMSFLSLSPFRINSNALPFYPCDIYTAVFSLASYMLIKALRDSPSRRITGLYFVVFLLATINRETSVLFLPLFFFSLSKTHSLRWRALCSAAQLVAYFLIRGYISQNFSGFVNPAEHMEGTSYELHVLSNLKEFFNLFNLKSILFGVSCGGLLLLLLAYRTALTSFNKLSLLLFVAPAFLASCVFGIASEKRIFVEVVVVLWAITLELAMTEGKRQREKTAAAPKE